MSEALQADGRELRFSIVVPVYNSARTLAELHARLCAALESLGSFEIILVDDGSQDGSFARMQELRAADPRVRIVQLMRNFGQHNALVCGLARARGRVVITLDDDLQNPPEEIKKLVDTLTDDLDCVLGVTQEKRQSWSRNAASRLASHAAGWILRKGKRVRFSPFTAMRAELVAAMVLQRTAFVFIPALLYTTTMRIGEVEVRHDPRREGQSRYGWPRLLKLTSNLIFQYSNLPLRLVSVFGMTVALAAAIMAGWIVLRRLAGGPGPVGWPSLFTAVVFFGGATLCTLGIIGEYLIRIIADAASKPTFVVRREDG